MEKAMNKITLIYAVILLLCVFVSAVSQVILKKAAQKKYASVLKEYINPLVIFAYMMFFATTIVSILAYKGIPLSMGPVLEATSYVYVTIFGATIFKEKINKKRLLALAFILIGIIIYSFFG
jgi:drug/metabolite transporter (DMT)-like permease